MKILQAGIILHYLTNFFIQAPFKVVGIYSICDTNFTENEFTKKAYFRKRRTKQLLNLLKIRKGFADYVSYDVCFDEKKLSSIILSLSVDPEFFEVTKAVGRFKHSMETKILFIVTHLDDHMLRMVLSAFDKIFVLSDNPLLDTTLPERYDNFIHLEGNVKDIENFIRKKPEWREIIILRDVNDRRKNYTVFENIIRMIHGIKDCYKTFSIRNYTDIKTLKAYLKNKEVTNEKDEYTVFIQASFFDRGNVIKLINDVYGNKTILLSAVDRNTEYYDKTRTPWFVPLSSEFRRSIENSESLGYTQDKDLDYFNVFLSFKNLERYFYLRPKFIRNILQSRFRPKIYENRLPEHSQSKCNYPTCPPGYEISFGRIINESSVWDEEIGYYCKPCENNYYKSTYGDVKCQQCKGYFITNPKNTNCIDPLVPIYLQFTDLTEIITLIICAIGLCFSLLATTTYIKYRSTPIVKASELVMSLIHLISIKTTFIILPAVYFIKLTSTLCAFRAVSISFFMNVTISIIYIKSLKLLKAFQSKFRATQSEIIKTKLTQVFAAVMNIVIAALLNTILWYKEFPAVLVNPDIPNLKKFFYCNNGPQINVVVVFLILLLILCFCQAFRCRQLPNHVNDAMSVVYAAFIACITFGVMFPIYYSQKQPEDRALVHVLVFAINNLAFLLFMYGKKTLIILFRPEKNTKQYFRALQLEQIEMKARIKLK